jgi:hypothetical protein
LDRWHRARNFWEQPHAFDPRDAFGPKPAVAARHYRRWRVEVALDGSGAWHGLDHAIQIEANPQ